MQDLQPLCSNAGDYVECVVEHIIVPQFAEDYYGPNRNLRAALEKNQNTWKMISREMLGNDLEIEVTHGRLMRRRPTLIQSDGNKAEFAIAGGLGYVPITISGLRAYRAPVLEIKDGDAWQVVDQSAHGKDFWQTDYDAATGTWEITYSVPLDTPDDGRVKRQMRFGIGR